MIAVRILAVAPLLFCLILPGCSGGGPSAKPEAVKVSGKALLPGGSPLTGGTLVLRPESGLYGATAEIQSDGSFTLQDSGNPAVVPGQYQVFVRFSDPAHNSLKNTLNSRYQQSSEDGDSDVVVDIQGTTENLVIRFKR